MNRNKNILIFTKRFYPGYKAGGPIRSIFNLVESLNDSFNFYIVTLDRDSFETKSYEGIIPNTWVKVNKANVYYVSPINLNFSLVKSIINGGDYDKIYLNSFFSLKFSIFPLFAVNRSFKNKVILAPRGELSGGALSIKPYRKIIFIKLLKFLSLHKNIMWHATSNEEKTDIIKVFKKQMLNIETIPNIASSLNKKSEKKWFKNNRLNIVFLSRISQKKNLLFCFNTFKNLDIPVLFSIYGIVEDLKYWEDCLKLIQDLPDNIVVEYKGVVPNECVYDVLMNYDLFFLPTLNENFGHAIVESFLAGVPVLISDQTPWKNLTEHGVGWDLNLKSPLDFSRVLNEYYISLSKGEYFSSVKISDWANSMLQLDSTVSHYRILFK